MSINFLSRKAKPGRKTFGFGLGVMLILMSLVLVGVVSAAPITIIDDAGPDDEPGQKDLNQLTVDFNSGVADIVVTWNWDVISVSGNNTGDACSLYDTDDDGNANYSLCVVWDNGSSYQTTRLYVCGDGAADKCDQPRDLLAEDTDLDGDLEEIIDGPYSSTCDLTTVPDTFGARNQAQADTDFDTQATCHIELDDFGGADAFLINVCSYPSQVPGSDPSDCVISPNSGFLTIVKVAIPEDGTTFDFDLGAGQASNDGSTSFSIDGNGSVDLVGFADDTDYDLTEDVPSGWQLDSASCTLSDGTSTGASSATGVTDFEIQVGRETTCTFTDSLASGTLTVIKTVVNDNGGTAEVADFLMDLGGTTSTSFAGAESPGITTEFEAGTAFSVTETGPSGYTPSFSGDCAGTIEAGVDKTCTITNDDVAPKLTLIKAVDNGDGGNALPDDFLLTVDGNGVSSAATNTYLANVALALDETQLTGYTFVSITGTGLSGCAGWHRHPGRG